MFCPNCGKPLDDGAKFCSACGNPAPEAPAASEVTEAPVVEAPVAEATAAPVSETPTAQANEAPAPTAPVSETPAVSAAPAAEAPKAPEAPALTISQDNMVLALRVVCGVLGAIFAFFALKGAFGFVDHLFNNIAVLPAILRGYYPIGVTAHLFRVALNLLMDLLRTAAPALAAAVLILAAAKWDKKHADFIFCGVAAAAALRLALFILAFPVNLLLSILLYHGSMGFAPSFFTTSLLHVLGYALAAGVVFGLMYLMGCAPVMGKTAEQVKENLRASVSDFSGMAKEAAEKVSKNAAPAAAPTAAAVPAAPAPAAYRRRMNTNRGLLMYILLNIVTCGIYSYILIHNLASDANEVCQGDGQKTGGLLAFILLGFITCGIYQLIWWYKLCNRMAANAPRYGILIQENGTTYLLWTLIGIFLCGIGPLIAMHQILRNMNALCAAYNQYNGLTA